MPDEEEALPELGWHPGGERACQEQAARDVPPDRRPVHDEGVADGGESGLHPLSETQKQAKVLRGRTDDARTTIPDLQPRVQGSCRSPDSGRREDSRGGRRTAAAAAAAVYVA